jgi:hypothetical protein
MECKDGKLGSSFAKIQSCFQREPASPLAALRCIAPDLLNAKTFFMAVLLTFWLNK